MAFSQAQAKAKQSISPRNKREPGNVQIPPNNATDKGVSNSRGSNSEIVGLTKPDPKDIEAREKSRQGQKSPEQLELFQDGADLGLGPNIKESFNFTKLKTKPGDDTEFEPVSTDNTSQEENFDTQEPGETEYQNPQMELPLSNPNNTRVIAIKDKLKAAGINMTYDEVSQLMKSNFKVKFPFGMLTVCISKAFISWTGYLMGIFLTVMGLGTKLIPIPFLSFLAGTTITAIGFAIQIFTFFTTSILMTILLFAVRNYYVNNASDITTKVGLVRRYVYKKIAERFWLKFFGSALPFIGFIVDISITIMCWLHIKREANKIKKIVESTK